jgi:dsDNA-specific endonuclease/ATPase MutS2
MDAYTRHDIIISMKRYRVTQSNAQEPANARSPHEPAIFAAELGDAISIDLHGLDTNNAIHQLDEFMHKEFMRRTQVIKIIHGQGEQKLQFAVNKHLKNHKLIEYFRGSQSPSQQGAVTYAVLIRRK